MSTAQSATAIDFTKLTPTHAAAATRLHIAGQPGTFLSSLGPAVLAVFYRALPQSPVGFGFVARDDRHTAVAPETEAVIGFVAATTSTGRLFLELGTRQLPGFMPPLLKRFAHQPSLIGKAVQTVLYPLLHRGDGRADGKVAELLAIMVEPAWRSQGVGARLVTGLIDECVERDLDAIDVTVDAQNEGARRFYAKHGFSEQGRFTLYGRAMCIYRLPISQ